MTSRAGINMTRIYPPIKQVPDQDPDGVFIRRYRPELREVPKQYLAESHTIPVRVRKSVGCVVGKGYPVPVVEHAGAYREARRRMHALKRTPEAAPEASRVYRKHGSRRTSGKASSASP